MFSSIDAHLLVQPFPVHSDCACTPDKHLLQFLKERNRGVIVIHINMMIKSLQIILNGKPFHKTKPHHCNKPGLDISCRSRLPVKHIPFFLVAFQVCFCIGICCTKLVKENWNKQGKIVEWFDCCSIEPMSRPTQSCEISVCYDRFLPK
jgi:hypothetical protein